MVAWQSEISLCTFEFIRMLIGEKLQPFSTSSVLTSSFFMSEKSISGHLLNLASYYIYVS